MMYLGNTLVGYMSKMCIILYVYKPFHTLPMIMSLRIYMYDFIASHYAFCCSQIIVLLLYKCNKT